MYWRFETLLEHKLILAPLVKFSRRKEKEKKRKQSRMEIALCLAYLSSSVPVRSVNLHLGGLHSRNFVLCTLENEALCWKLLYVPIPWNSCIVSCPGICRASPVQISGFEYMIEPDNVMKWS